MSTRESQVRQLQQRWDESPRWEGIKRGYSAEEVVRLRGSVAVEHTLARVGAQKLWKLMNETPFVNALGALTVLAPCLLAPYTSLVAVGVRVAATRERAASQIRRSPRQPVRSPGSLSRTEFSEGSGLLRTERLSVCAGRDSLVPETPVYGLMCERDASLVCERPASCSHFSNKCE